MKNNIEQKLKECLQQAYKNSDSFLHDIIFPVFGEENYESAGNLNILSKRPDLQHKADVSGILDIRQVGGLYVEGSQLDIFDVTLDYKKQLRSNRVEIQQIIRSILGTHSGAFIIFHYESGARWEWRFTFCHKGASQVDSSDAKRYTFLLGPGQSCRTAAENFMKIHEKIEREGEFEMDDIIKAFDVEALSKEFFEKYKAHYEKFCQFVYDHKNEPEWFGHEFAEWEDKTIRDYVKKLLGRIVFLHFLQKKGWLGVPADKEWGNGDVQFMKHLFEKATDEQKANYLDEVLEPLFAGALDVDRTSNDDLFDCGVEGFRNVKIPYLNGGLFERDKMDEPKSTFSCDLFADLFNFFYQYNFTIDENDPNDAEVGVDPEMLGRIFENLLEDNKDKGAFYTPKEIVQYMCKESLIAYLQTDIVDEDLRQRLRDFVHTYDVELIGGADSQMARDVDDYLKAVKICDPAIGSGAFPMGVMKELYLCRSSIEGFGGKKAVEIKKHIIQQNIYGVDIERGAVDIARLRFWLSLILDEETPHALPNLDFKIMQGNSLLEQYEGIDLSKLGEGKKISTQKVRIKKKKYDMSLQTEFVYDGTDAIGNIQKYLREYFSITDHQKKEEHKNSINRAVHDFIRVNVPENNIEIKSRIENLPIPNDQFFLWHLYFKEVFDKGGFDIVIGNPPYIQLQKDGGALAELYKPCGFKTFDRMGDIYSLFYEHGNNLLKTKGVLCYITSNKWMRTGYGERTRAYFKDEVCPHILIDFVRMKLFDDATVETNILLFSKEEYSLPTCCASLVEIKKEELYNLNGLIRENSYLNKFTTTDFWTLSDAATGSLKNKIKASGTALKEWKLKVNFGIKTGFNEAFIITTEKKNELLSACSTGLERKLTEEIIHPIIRGKDVGVYLNNWAGLWILNVHNGLRGKLDRIDVEQLPTLKAYLDGFIEKLSKRADKGDTPYNLRNCAYLPSFDLPKIIWKRIGSILRFVYDEEKSMCLDSTCFATGEHVKFLCAIFNSKLGHFILQDSPKTGTGDLLISVQAIEPIVVPFPSNDLKEKVESLVDRILAAKKLNPQDDTSALEAEIDRLVYDLYGLSEDEIAIVEGASK